MESIFGTMHHVSVEQESARAVLVFVYGLIVLRVSGRRTFAQWSAIDIVVSIIVGSSLSRAMTGSAPLWGTLAAVAVLVLLHLGVSYAVARNQKLSKLIEGDSVVLASDGHIEKANLHCHLVSLSDLGEALRGKGLDGLAALGNTKRIELEPSGKISIVKGD